MRRGVRLLVALGGLCAASCGRLGYESADRDLPSDDGGPGFDGGAGLDAGPALVDGAVPGATGVADTSISGFDSTPNGAEPILICGRSMGGPLSYPLLRFDLASVSRSSVTRARMRLYQSGSRGSGTFTVDVHRVLQEWDEATADWSSPTPSTTWSGGDYDGTPVASTDVPVGTNGWYEWDITPLVNAWLASEPNFGVQLTFGTVSTGTWIEWTSSEGTLSERPELVLE